MQAINTVQSSRRHALARRLQSLTIATAIVSGVALSGFSTAFEPGWGADPACGIEPSCGAEPTCGIEPSCGAEESSRCVSNQCNCQIEQRVIYVRPRKLSFAEKILKQLDRVGDQIETDVANSKAKKSQSKSCVSCAAQEVSCGVEGAEPSCGSEFNSSTCQCPTCISHRSSPMWTEPASEGYGSNSGPGWVHPVVPKESPMHPHYPIEEQAMGSIGDQAHSNARPQSPNLQLHRDAPVIGNAEQDIEYGELQTGNPLNKPQLPNSFPNASATEIDRLTPHSHATIDPKTIPSSDDDFTPRYPTSARQARDAADDFQGTQQRGLPPSPASQRSAPPTRLPDGLDVPHALPKPGQKVPDVLVDPFRDDVTFQEKRQRMNGMQSSTRTTPAAVTSSGIPKLRPVPNLGNSDNGVVRAAMDSLDPNSGVVQSSHTTPMPVVSKTTRAPIVHTSSDEFEMPAVKRKSVPR